MPSLPLPLRRQLNAGRWSVCLATLFSFTHRASCILKSSCLSIVPSKCYQRQWCNLALCPGAVFGLAIAAASLCSIVALLFMLTALGLSAT